jgi:hypothetical protein
MSEYKFIRVHKKEEIIMALSQEAKEILVVALANRSKANELSTAVDANTSTVAANVAATALNTTHRTSAGTDHSDVGLNNTHRTSAGTDHSDVGLNNTHRAADGKDHSDVVLNNAHRVADGKDHSDVVLNNAARNVNYKIANIMIATTNDTTTDATTLGVAVDDFVVEVDVAAGGVVGSGVIVAPNTFVGAVTIGSILMHFTPIV